MVDPSFFHLLFLLQTISQFCMYFISSLTCNNVLYWPVNSNCSKLLLKTILMQFGYFSDIVSSFIRKNSDSSFRMLNRRFLCYLPVSAELLTQRLPNFNTKNFWSICVFGDNEKCTFYNVSPTAIFQKRYYFSPSLSSYFVFLLCRKRSKNLPNSEFQVIVLLGLLKVLLFNCIINNPLPETTLFVKRVLGDK